MIELIFTLIMAAIVTVIIARIEKVKE